MIEIHPQINNYHNCPYCEHQLISKTFVINGERNLVKCTCTLCEKDFLVDLPSGYGLYYPTMVDLSNDKIFDPVGVSWFSDKLLRSLREKDLQPVEVKVTKYKDCSEYIIINCLDWCYGDSLLKLFNTQYYLDKFPQMGCWLLIPKQLSLFIPEGVAEVWEVNLPFKKMVRWYESLEDKIAASIESRNKCYLSITYLHPHPSLYSLDRFVRFNGAGVSGLRNPIITFSYREDRLWGRTKKQQTKNINRLYELLRKQYPPLSFVLAGFGSCGGFSVGIVDKRVTSFVLEMEQFWIDLYGVTDCVVGVHGSHMIIPSGLAKCVVNLLPSVKYSHFFEDMVMNPRFVDVMENVYRSRVIYGNRTLNDLSPRIVANIIKSQMDGWALFKDFMGEAWQQRCPLNPVLNPMPIVEHFRQFKTSPPHKVWWKRLIARYHFLSIIKNILGIR